jgi:hypothetical protein
MLRSRRTAQHLLKPNYRFFFAAFEGPLLAGGSAFGLAEGFAFVLGKESDDALAFALAFPTSWGALLETLTAREDKAPPPLPAPESAGVLLFTPVGGVVALADDDEAALLVAVTTVCEVAAAPLHAPEGAGALLFKTVGGVDALADDDLSPPNLAAGRTCVSAVVIDCCGGPLLLLSTAAVVDCWGCRLPWWSTALVAVDCCACRLLWWSTAVVVIDCCGCCGGRLLWWWLTDDAAGAPYPGQVCPRNSFFLSKFLLAAHLVQLMRSLYAVFASMWRLSCSALSLWATLMSLHFSKAFSIFPFLTWSSGFFFLSAVTMALLAAIKFLNSCWVMPPGIGALGQVIVAHRRLALLGTDPPHSFRQ